jgi:hypothetical protein
MTTRAKSWWGRVAALGLLVAMMMPMLASADATWPVYLNGVKTSLKATVQKDGTVLAPMVFPVGEHQQDYDLSIHTDAVAHKVFVQRTPRGPKLRGDEKCYHCSGTGKCQNDYPAGSGIIYSGQACSVCSGTGKCWYCEGTGDKKW